MTIEELREAVRAVSPRTSLEDVRRKFDQHLLDEGFQDTASRFGLRNIRSPLSLLETAALLDIAETAKRWKEARDGNHQVAIQVRALDLELALSRLEGEQDG